MKKTLVKISLFFIAVYSISHLTSCNEVPVEIPLVQDTLTVYSLSSIDADIIKGKYQHYKEIDGPFNYQFQLLGKSDNYKSHVMYRFAGIPNDMGDISELDILEATLYLYTDQYAFGDTVNFQQEFTVHELLDSVSRFKSFSDIFDANDNASEFSYEVGAFSGKAEPKDSIPIKVELDKQLLLKWFDFAAKEDSIRNIWTDSTKTLDLTKEENRYLFHSYSIGLKAGQNSKVINRFINRTDLDTLFNTQIKLVVKKQGIDTTIYLKNTIAAYYPYAPEIEETDDIYLQGVGQTRTIFDFDVSEIPPLSAILSCQLELTLDTINSEFGTFGKSSYLAGASSDDPFFTPGSENLSTWAYAAVSSDSLKHKYKFSNLTPLIDSWNRKEGKGKFVLSPSRGTSALVEVTYFDKYIFYGLNNPDINKRPKLLIIYSKRPNI